MKPAMVFEGKEKSFLCVSQSENGGLEFFAQNEIDGVLISLPLKEVRELAAHLEAYLRALPSLKGP